MRLYNKILSLFYSKKELDFIFLERAIKKGQKQIDYWNELYSPKNGYCCASCGLGQIFTKAVKAQKQRLILYERYIKK